MKSPLPHHPTLGCLKPHSPHPSPGPPAPQILVSCTKGILNDTLETPHDILKRVLPERLHPRWADPLCPPGGGGAGPGAGCEVVLR